MMVRQMPGGRILALINKPDKEADARFVIAEAMKQSNLKRDLIFTE